MSAILLAVLNSMLPSAAIAASVWLLLKCWRTAPRYLLWCAVLMITALLPLTYWRPEPKPIPAVPMVTDPPILVGQVISLPAGHSAPVQAAPPTRQPFHWHPLTAGSRTSTIDITWLSISALMLVRLLICSLILH